MGPELLGKAEPSWNNTPLHIAVSFYCPPLVKVLLPFSNLAAENNDEKTPLLLAESELLRVSGEIDQTKRSILVGQVKAVIDLL